MKKDPIRIFKCKEQIFATHLLWARKRRRKRRVAQKSDWFVLDNRANIQVFHQIIAVIEIRLRVRFVTDYFLKKKRDQEID